MEVAGRERLFWLDSFAVCWIMKTDCIRDAAPLLITNEVKTFSTYRRFDLFYTVTVGLV